MDRRRRPDVYVHDWYVEMIRLKGFSYPMLTRFSCMDGCVLQRKVRSWLRLVLLGTSVVVYTVAGIWGFAHVYILALHVFMLLALGIAGLLVVLGVLFVPAYCAVSSRSVVCRVTSTLLILFLILGFPAFLAMVTIMELRDVNVILMGFSNVVQVAVALLAPLALGWRGFNVIPWSVIFVTLMAPVPAALKMGVNPRVDTLIYGISLIESTLVALGIAIAYWRIGLKLGTIASLAYTVALILILYTLLRKVWPVTFYTYITIPLALVAVTLYVILAVKVRELS